MIIQSVSTVPEGGTPPGGSSELRGPRTDVTFTVTKADLDRAKPTIEQVAREVGTREVRYDEDVVKVSIVGLGMRSHAGVAAKMFRVLAEEGINIQAISTSEIKVSCLVAAKYTELAVRALHDAFELAKNPGTAPPKG